MDQSVQIPGANSDLQDEQNLKNKSISTQYKIDLTVTLINSLTESIRKKLLEREIIFQEEKISFNKLIDNSDENLIRMIGPETLDHLIRDEKIRIGSKPQGISDLQGAYSVTFEQVNTDIFVDKLSSQQSDDIYIISGIRGSGKTDILINSLNGNIDVNKISSIKNQTGEIQQDVKIINKRIQLADDRFAEEDFKKICQENPERKIFWIQLHESKSDTKANFKSESRSDSKFDFKTESKSKSDSNSESKSNSKSESISDCKSEPISDSKSDSKSKPDSKSESKFDSKSESKFKFKLAQIYNPGFYQEAQRFNDQVVISKNVKELLASPTLSETFIFAGKTKNQVSNWLRFNDENEKLRFENNCHRIKFVASQDDPKDTFEASVEENPDQTIHFLEFVQDQPIWNKTHGCLGNLSKYRSQEYNKTCLIDENNLAKKIKDQKVVIIAGDPGMGKSTTLIKLYESNFGLEDPMDKSHCIINVNLRNNLRAIKEINFNANETDFDMETTVEFLSKIKNSPRDNCPKDFLNLLLRNKFTKPLLITFDGFDQVSDKQDRDKIISLLILLRDKTSAKIWITTRLHNEQILASALSTFAIKIEAMDYSTSSKFINQYLDNRLGLMISDEERAKLFCKIDQINKDASTRMTSYSEAFLVFNGTEFTGIPLQLYLMLEGSANHFQKWIQNNQDPHFSYLADNKYQLYQNFVDRKCKLYFRKADITQQRQNTATFDKHHQNLAKHLICKTEESLEEFREFLSIGITKFDGRNIDFIHPTFAEYFAANLFTHWIKKWKQNRHELMNLQKQKYFTSRILLEPNYILIRRFLDCRFSKEKIENVQFREEFYNQDILFTAVAENNVNIASFVVNNFRNANVNAKNKDGSSIFCRAVESGNLDMVHFLIKQGAQVNDPDCKLHIPAASGNLQMVQCLLKQGAPINTKDSSGRPILQVCTNFEMVKLLVNKGADVNAANKSGWSVLHSAVEFVQSSNFPKSENLEIVQFLIERGAHIQTKDSHGRSILESAVRAGNQETVKFLLKMGAYVNDKDVYGRSILHSAAEFLDMELFKLLVDKGADVCAKDGCGRSVLEGAIKSGNLEISSFLLAKVDDVTAAVNNKDHCGKSLLHIAATSGRLKSVEFLLEQAANVNAKDQNGKSALHHAVEHGCSKIVKLLVEQDCGVNTKDRDEDSVLHCAVRFGNLKTVEYLLDRGAKINDKNRNGGSVLHLAARNGDLKMVEFLVDRGALITAKDKDGRSVLHLAAQNGNLNLVKFLLNRNARVNDRDKHVVSILHNAAESGNFELVKYLVDRGAEVRVRDKTGRSVLHRAVGVGNFEMVKFLVKLGENVSVLDNHDTTVLHIAARSGNLEMVKFLVDGGAKVNGKDKECCSVLHNAAEVGNFETVEFLVQEGARVNAVDRKDRSVLHNAIVSRNLAMVKFLVDQGADVNAKDESDRSILHLATEFGDLDMVKFLVQKGADVHARDEEKRSILHRAAASGNLDIVKFLIQKGVDVHAKDDRGRSAVFFGNLGVVEFLLDRCDQINAEDDNGCSLLHYAAEDGNLEMAKFLLNRGAKINAKCKKGSSALHCAAKFVDLKMVEFLVKHGADVNARDKGNRSVLEYAIESIDYWYNSSKLESWKILEFLINNGADVSFIDFRKNLYSRDMTDYLERKTGNPGASKTT